MYNVDEGLRASKNKYFPNIYMFYNDIMSSALKGDWNAMV